MTKGYVVRGTWKGQAACCWNAEGHLAQGPEMAHRFAAVSDALAVRITASIRMPDAAIFAVAEDGTETALPIYEEALAALSQTQDLLSKATDDVLRMSAEIGRLRAIVDLARCLMQSSDLDTTSGERAGITCDEEPFAALQNIFEAEREAARTIPGLVCAECDRPIYRGTKYAGKGGHAAHDICRVWPKETTFKVAGDGEQKARA